MPAAEPEIIFLTEGGQDVDLVADRLLSFLAGARHSLDLAIYDGHFERERGGRDLAGEILDALNDAEKRGVQVRAVFNDDDGPGPYPAGTSPRTGPSFLARLMRAVPARGVDGRFDLMHHKYIVRDAEHEATAAVWTGSTNFTTDSWTRMENEVLIVPGTDLAAAYITDFEPLWRKRDVEGSGRFDDQPAALTYEGQPFSVRALFSPGRGRKMSQVIARRIGEAQDRVRMCSPVLTSTPILGTIAEVIEDQRVDTLVTVDATQMRQVLGQWRADGRAQWKGPLYERIRSSGQWAGKRSRPYRPDDVHDFMHAKLIVCDDWVLTGSFNCSHSGERNAENLLEIRSKPFADRCAAFVEAVHERYRHYDPDTRSS